VHKSIEIQLPKNDYFTRYFTFHVKMCEFCQLIFQRGLKRSFNVLKSSRDQLQEYALENRGFHLKNSG